MKTLLCKFRKYEMNTTKLINIPLKLGFLLRVLSVKTVKHISRLKRYETKVCQFLNCRNQNPETIPFLLLQPLPPQHHFSSKASNLLLYITLTSTMSLQYLILISFSFFTSKWPPNNNKNNLQLRFPCRLH